jgi:N-sulfoglucosamine sulfohydrolase
MAAGRFRAQLFRGGSPQLIAVLVLLVHVPVLAQLALAAPQPRPNILLLMAEDMSARVGAFGDDVAVTPNLDQLAEEGVRYPNTFTAAGVCAPSRAAHITGMHQISFGGQHMRTSGGPLGSYKAVPPPEVKAYPELLRGAGYYTWTDHKLDYQFSGGLANSGPFTIWDDEGGNGHWRNRDPDQPFFGLVNFNITHESGVFTPLWNWPHSFQHLTMQVMRAVTLPSVEENEPVRPEQVKVPPYYPDTPTVRADMARHYNNIAVMDRQVGEILAELEVDGLADSTIVIWTTDHGDGLPRGKRDLFDAGIQVPMIIRWPEAYRPPGVAAHGIDTRMISFIDFAPTILRLAGVELPSYIQGRDFVEADPREYIFASRDRIDEVEDRQRAVRDDRYKYIRSWHPDQPGGHHLAYRDNMDMMIELWSLLETGGLNAAQRQWFEAPGEERLFDLKSDPHELHNLVGDPAYRTELERMRNALTTWQERVDDWSEESEAEMLARFRPDGEARITAVPALEFRDGRLHLSCNTAGASIGYRVSGGRWQLYTQPVAVSAGEEVEAKAVRYGWEESESMEGVAP